MERIRVAGETAYRPAFERRRAPAVSNSTRSGRVVKEQLRPGRLHAVELDDSDDLQPETPDFADLPDKEDC